MIRLNTSMKDRDALIGILKTSYVMHKRCGEKLNRIQVENKRIENLRYKTDEHKGMKGSKNNIKTEGDKT